MNELGNLLKKTREGQNKTLTTVKNETRIQEQFLSAIESGDYEALPSYLHAYGFVKQYSEYLGFKYDDVKGLFDVECPKSGLAENEEQQLRYGDKLIVPENMGEKTDSIKSTKTTHAKSTTPKNIKSNNKGGFPIVTLITVVVVITVIAVIFINTSQREKAQPLKVLSQDFSNVQVTEIVVNDNSSADNVTDNNSAMTPMKDNLTVKPVANVVAFDNKTVVRDNLTITPKPLPPLPIMQTATISFTEDCWWGYNADNKTKADYLSPAGTSLPIRFEQFFIIDIGNAAAVTIKFNNQELTGFGGQGIVRKIKYRNDNGTLVRAE